jgi:uncharacterized protein YndB with AHSA1/START domain
MPANLYRFEESWFIPALPEAVWDVLADGKLLPEWWKGVYLESVPLGDYPGPAVGNRYRSRARGFLPYKLNFVTETAALDRPGLVSVNIAGDLTGTWTARLSPRDGGTHVAIEQVTTADKCLLRWLSPLLKPLFAWNHRWTTPRGEAGLTAYLEQRKRPTLPSSTGDRQA